MGEIGVRLFTADHNGIGVVEPGEKYVCVWSPAGIKYHWAGIITYQAMKSRMVHDF